MSSVAILGCGPAGLLVAHAARLCGHTVTILSKKQKSPMEGAQYMHTEIPGIRLPDPGVIKYMLFGKVEQYRDKVYGSGDPDIVVSPQQFLGEHKCWDLRYTYKRLWLHWRDRIVDTDIHQHTLEMLVENHDLVFSTIPATVLCQHYLEGEGSHKFDYVPVWIDGMWSGPTPAEDKGLWGSTQNIVICNGFEPSMLNPELTGWYRTSFIYGHANTEWSKPALIPERRQRSGRIWRVRKPLSTNCSCWPSIIRVGRYGRWEKGQLTHHAFETAMDVLS